MDRLAEAFAQGPGFQGLTLVDDAGHWVQYERADVFDAALARVLQA
jgi:pimeloyl-ACP methyl ester carboxylesterase